MANFILHSDPVQRLAGKLGFYSGSPDASIASAKAALQVAHNALLRRVLSDYAIDCVIDVGANRGQFGLLIRSLGYTGPLVSFEPATEQFEVLKSHASADPGWQVRNEALGEIDGSLALNIMARSEFSSVLPPSSSQPVQFANRNTIKETRTVAARRLDSVAPEIPAIHQARRMLLKMDTQGADLTVFRGASGVISQIAAVQTEMAGIAIYQGMPTISESLSFFEKAGYAPCSIVPVSRERSSLAVVEFDCLLVSRNISLESPNL